MKDSLNHIKMHALETYFLTAPCILDYIMNEIENLHNEDPNTDCS